MILEISVLGFIGLHGVMGFFKGGIFFLKKWLRFLTLIILFILFLYPLIEMLQFAGLKIVIQGAFEQIIMRAQPYQVVVNSLMDFQNLLTEGMISGFLKDFLVFLYIFVLNQPVGVSISGMLLGKLAEIIIFIVAIGILLPINHFINRLFFQLFRFHKDNGYNIGNNIIGLGFGLIKATSIITIIMVCILWISQTLSWSLITTDTIFFQANDEVPILRIFAEFAKLIVQYTYPGGI